jgi:hypothetical protein
MTRPHRPGHQENAERAEGSPELLSYVSNLMAAWSSRYQSKPLQPSLRRFQTH